MSHTILLYQSGKSPSTRSFSDYSSLAKAADGCIALFEEALKKKNPSKPQISYSAQELHAFMDGMESLGCLVFDPKINAYVPYDKAFLKQQTLLRLQELARNAAANQSRGGGGRR